MKLSCENQSTSLLWYFLPSKPVIVTESIAVVWLSLAVQCVGMEITRSLLIVRTTRAFKSFYKCLQVHCYRLASGITCHSPHKRAWGIHLDRRKHGNYFGMVSDSISETLMIRQGCFGPIAGKHHQDIIPQNGKLHEYLGELSMQFDNRVLQARISGQCWD